MSELRDTSFKPASDPAEEDFDQGTFPLPGDVRFHACMEVFALAHGIHHPETVEIDPETGERRVLPAVTVQVGKKAARYMLRDIGGKESRMFRQALRHIDAPPRDENPGGAAWHQAAENDSLA